MSDMHDFRKTSGVRGDLDFAPEIVRQNGKEVDLSASLTRQEFAEECDINTIMARYEASGVVSHVNRSNPVFLDTTNYPGLQASMDLFREAALSFNALPATVRREFDNDPQKFVDFAADPANLDRMREWGLAEPVKAEPAPIRVEVSNPTPQDPPPAPPAKA